MNNKKQKEVFRKTCKTLVDNGGICFPIDCNDCPFFCGYHEYDDCATNGFRDPGDYWAKNTALVESAKQWLKDNPVMNGVQEIWKVKARRLKKRAEYGY